MNKAILMGNLGAAAEGKQTSGGNFMMRFSLATSKKWKTQSGEQHDRTDWHRCVMWGERAEKLCQYMSKGTKVLVSGEIQYGKYTDRDGAERHTTDINVLEVEFCGGGQREPSSGGGYAQPARGQAFEPDDDDIPF